MFAWQVSDCYGISDAREIFGFEISGIRPGFARAMIDFEDDTPLPGSRLLCLTSLSPLILRVILRVTLDLFLHQFFIDSGSATFSIYFEGRLVLKLGSELCNITTAESDQRYAWFS